MPAATTVNEETVQTLSIHLEIAIGAPIQIAWEAVLDQVGDKCEMPDGSPFPFKRTLVPSFAPAGILTA